MVTPGLCIQCDSRDGSIAGLARVENVFRLRRIAISRLPPDERILFDDTEAAIEESTNSDDVTQKLWFKRMRQSDNDYAPTLAKAPVEALQACDLLITHMGGYSAQQSKDLFNGLSQEGDDMNRWVATFRGNNVNPKAQMTELNESNSVRIRNPRIEGSPKMMQPIAHIVPSGTNRAC